VLEFAAVERPEPAAGQVLVKVRAASVNPLDWHFMRGSPYFMRLMSGIGTPADTRLGVDFAGTVVAVGESVTRYQPGDEVFGGATGAFAEYVVVRESGAIALKPGNVSFEEAASVPIAAITALQALRDKGQLQAGQKVLINGASGGVGTFAVQIAKALGAEVTGVCSTRNVEMVRSIGADHVFDYKKENYTESERRYDLIVDMVGNHSVRENLGVLEQSGTLVLVGGGKGDWVEPLKGPLQVLLLSPFVDREIALILAQLDSADLAMLAELMEKGEVKPVIDRRYTLEQVPEALRYSESGRARGKIIITVSQD
jgi:NADPH:quinone reductase-like Zn-dependent oxidoreductase